MLRIAPSRNIQEIQASEKFKPNHYWSKKQGGFKISTSTFLTKGLRCLSHGMQTSDTATVTSGDLLRPSHLAPELEVQKVRDTSPPISNKLSASVEFRGLKFASASASTDKHVALAYRRFTYQLVALAHDRHHQLRTKLELVPPDVFVIKPGPHFLRKARAARRPPRSD